MKREKVIALIDGDILIYMSAFHAQESFDWDGDGEPTVVASAEEATHTLEDLVGEIMEDINADEAILCLSCPTEEGWRRKILPTYKLNRASVTPPILKKFLTEYVKKTYKTALMPTFEGDDMMGLYATHPSLCKGHKVICSSDKDMQTVVGDHYNFHSKKRFYVTEERAENFHMFQTLTGDTTDNYKGCPKIGKVKAQKILDNHPEDLWEGVLEAFERAGLSEEDALTQARVAKICQAEDIDLDKGEVRLWRPKTECS